MVLAILVSTPLAGQLLDTLGYRVVFPVAGALGVVSVLIFSRLHLGAEPVPSLAKRSLGGIWRIARDDRRFAIYLVGLVLYGFGALVASPFYPLVQVNRLELSYTVIGALGVAQSLAWILGLPFWGRLLDRRGPLWLLRLGVLMNAFVPFTYIWATSGWMLAPAFIFTGLVLGSFDLGIINAGIQLAPRDRVLEYTGLQTTVVGIRGIIAPFVGAALLGLGYSDRLVFALGAALILAAWLVLARVRYQPVEEGVDEEVI